MAKRSAVSSNNVKEIVISFDTTGSMYPCLAQVRRNVMAMVKVLFSCIPGLRIAIIAHGDYCDKRSTYVTKTLDFTNNVGAICRFVQNVEPTDGGDAPECYELVLHEARTKLSWTAGATKVLVVIGDNIPHDKSHFENTLHLDWRNELKLLLEAQIHVYGVHALGHHHTRSFYEEIARRTGGFCLELDQFRHVQDTIMAICLKQAGSEQLRDFEQQVINAGRMDLTLDLIFSILMGRSKNAIYEVPRGGLIPVPRGRFQVLDVDDDCPIRTFVENNDLTFNKGRGFYELVNSELIQEKKEVVLLHEASGSMFTGDEARNMIGLPYGVRGKINPKNLPASLSGFAVFVQSTSDHRKLDGNTRFLYEVDGWAEAA